MKHLKQKPNCTPSSSKFWELKEAGYNLALNETKAIHKQYTLHSHI